MSAIAGAGGSISPTSQTIEQGATATFEVTPEIGYSVDSVSGCSGSLDGYTYTTGAISGACTVEASFLLNAYTVSTIAGIGGAISPTSQAVAYGATATFTVTPEAGYSIDSVSGCAGSLDGNTYTTGVITGACTVEASFRMSTYDDVRWQVTQLVSVSELGGQGNGNSGIVTGSWGLAASADLRYVAFLSESTNLDPDANPAGISVYLRDRRAGTTTWIDNAACCGLDMSADGRYLVYVKGAIIRYDLTTGERQEIGFGSRPSMSADGSRMVYQSSDGVFLADVDSGTTTRLANKTSGGGVPGISADGSTVVFDTGDTDLADGDTNNDSDVFTYDVATGVYTLVSRSVATSGTANSGSTASRAINSDGSQLVFWSRATDLNENGGGASYGAAWLYDAGSNTNAELPTGASVTQLTDDGQLSYSTWTGGIYVYDIVAGTHVRIDRNTDGESGEPSSTNAHTWILLNATADEAVFASYASNLVEDDGNARPDVFHAAKIWAMSEFECCLNEDRTITVAPDVSATKQMAGYHSISMDSAVLIPETTGTQIATLDFETSDALEHNLTAPRGLTATAANRSVVLRCDAVPGANGYQVFWSRTPSIHPFTAASYEGFMVNACAGPVSIDQLDNDTEYFFIVTANRGAHQSEASIEVSATPEAGPMLIADRYRLEAFDAPTMVDLETGLEWQRCALGQQWNGAACTGSAGAYSLAGAQQATAALNRLRSEDEPEWRVPAIEELQGLVYCTSGMPAHFPDGLDTGCWGSHGIPTLESTVFPTGSAAGGWFWSGSAETDGRAWGVDFDRGLAQPYQSSAFSGVRLVRPTPTGLD